MEQVQLDWSTAEVSDGKLTVGFSAKPPKKWRDTFQRTALLLGAGRWEVALRVKQPSAQVKSVQPGDEDRVRQFLEGAVLEANATLVDEQALFEDGPAHDREEDQPDPDEPEASHDEALTGRFREFAGEQEDGDDE